MYENDTQFDKYTKIWSGPEQQKFFNRDCSVGRVLFNLMRNHPSKVCQISIDDQTIMTNREAYIFGIRIAQSLQAMGMKQDDVIGIICGNTTYLLPVVLGCFFNCTIFHAVNPQSDEETIKQQFLISRPKIIFCDGNIYARLAGLLKILKCNIYTLTHHCSNLTKIEDLLQPTTAETNFRPETLKLGGDQTVAIVCTPGTSGSPKTVCISNYACLPEFGGINNLDIVLSFGTIDWYPSLLDVVVAAAHSCTRIITYKPFTPALLMEITQNFNVTVLSLVPSQIRQLVHCANLSKDKLLSVSSLNIHGGSCTLLTLMKLREYLNTSDIKYGYMLTECGQVTSNVGLDHASSAGKLLAGVKVKIVDDTGRSLSHGGIGEIMLQNSQTWNGYYGNPSETKRMQDYQNWFHTADLGYFDSENYLHIVERKANVLKFHGMQYWPQEIEHVITELPDILDACVFGLWNEVDGDAAAAAAVKVAGSKLTEQDVVEYVARRLVVTHKQLHCGVFFVDSLPKTNTGKVLRNEARDLALGKKWQPITNANGK